MKQWLSLMLSLMLFCTASCGHRGARSDKSFEDIQKMVQDRTTSEVERILGKPDSREAMPLSGESWIWWNYTYLDGPDFPPEERGRVVHLKVLFEPDKPSDPGAVPVRLVLRASNPMAVSYMIPQGKPL